ncbi:unnamed protein product [Chrysodeixis includens]|uniref:Uncharacterized protein n=1 Tax=Chrysodeixis includens TaxID=689277 RepID=A0A9N8PZV9_CHRIL|nr:unnamed protein product [Chrysodeixis includens]
MRHGGGTGGYRAANGSASRGPLPPPGQWRSLGRSLELRTVFRPQRKPFRLQSFTDKPAGWSIIITFHTRDSVIYARRLGRSESIAMYKAKCDTRISSGLIGLALL